MTVATKVKIKKGDLVQMITGKDRGKQGRVLEARPLSKLKRWRLAEVLEEAK